VFEGLPVGQISAGALVALIVLLILAGRLVTRAQLRDVQANADKWESSATKWQEVATKHGMTLDRLITYAETNDHMLRELLTLADRGDR
jgi:hypothetical protein